MVSFLLNSRPLHKTHWDKRSSDYMFLFLKNPKLKSCDPYDHTHKNWILNRPCKLDLTSHIAPTIRSSMFINGLGFVFWGTLAFPLIFSLNLSFYFCLSSPFSVRLHQVFDKMCLSTLSCCWSMWVTFFLFYFYVFRL